MSWRAIHALVAIALVFGLTACTPPSGPVQGDSGLVYFVREKVGGIFTDGTVQLTVKKGSGAPVIDAVRSVDTSAGLQFLGAFAAGPDRKWGFNEMVNGFPPKRPGFGPLLPAVGATVTPGPLGTELLLGYKVVAPDYQARGAVEVDYHIGSSHYTLKAQLGFANCPKGLSYSACSHRFTRENW